jgi:predicted transcriptional regulator
MMKRIFWIDNIEQIIVLTRGKGVRLKILFLLRDKAYSPMRLSRRLKISPQSLNYHFSALHKAGFIYKKFEEKKRGSFESFYMATGDFIRIDSKVLGESPEPIFFDFDELHKKLSSYFEEEFKFVKSSSKIFVNKDQAIDFIQKSKNTNFSIISFDENE